MIDHFPHKKKKEKKKCPYFFLHKAGSEFLTSLDLLASRISNPKGLHSGTFSYAESSNHIGPENKEFSTQHTTTLLC
jgi:hypothetical protein